MFRRFSLVGILTICFWWYAAYSCGASILTWYDSTFSRVLDGNVILRGKIMGMDARNTGDRGSTTELLVFEWDPWYKLAWAADEYAGSFGAQQESINGRIHYRSVGWALGGQEGTAEYYIYDPVHRTKSPLVYSTDKAAAVTVDRFQFHSTLEILKGIAFVGAAVTYEMVKMTLRKTYTEDDIEIYLAVFVFDHDAYVEDPSYFLEGIYGPYDDTTHEFLETQPAWNYDDLPPDNYQAPGWTVELDQTKFMFDETNQEYTFNLLISNDVSPGERVPFVIFGKTVEDDGQIDYFTTEILGLETVPSES